MGEGGGGMGSVVLFPTLLSLPSSIEVNVCLYFPLAISEVPVSMGDPAYSAEWRNDGMAVVYLRVKLHTSLLTINFFLVVRAILDIAYKQEIKANHKHTGVKLTTSNQSFCQIGSPSFHSSSPYLQGCHQTVRNIKFG